MSKNKKKELFIVSNKFIFAIQVVVTLVLVYFINKLGLLPSRYLLPVVIVLALILALLGIFLFKAKGKGTKGFSKILSLLLSIALLIAMTYVVRGGNLVGLITGANKDTHVISVVVLKDSSYQTLDDVKDLEFGANTAMDADGARRGSELIEEKAGFTPTLSEYTSYESLMADLYDGSVEVVLLSESQRTFIEDIESAEGVATADTFAEKTRILDFVSYDEEVVVSDSDVDVAADTFSIFVTGIDTNGPVSTVSRSDVNMIVTVNPTTHQILLTSIPRDYYVQLGTKGAYDKLTHAGIYGVNESVTTLENLLGIDIDYYLKVNFTSVRQIVNALGGVDVYSQYSFTTRHGNYAISKGNNTLNGDQALGFVRERYSLPNGDNDRVRNQQELIIGILNKAMSPTIITNFNSILSSVGSSMQTSMPENDLKAIVRDQINTNASWDIQQYQLSGTGSSSTTTYSMPGQSVYVMKPDMNTVNNASIYIKAMENNEIISVE